MTKKKDCSPESKAKTVRELVEGDDGVGVVAARHRLGANMVSGWRRQLFDDAAVTFSRGQQVRRAQADRGGHRKEVDNPNRIIGQLTAERDYPQRGLGERLDGLGL